jgi:antitoxin component YwqK of YwqJK toxin-antitoxin module
MDILDAGSLFELLLRFHYPDLQNFTRAYPNVSNITNNEYFKTKWHEYNIHVVTCILNTQTIDTEMDRSGVIHGSITVKNITDNNKISQVHYIQNVRHGPYTTWYYAMSNRIETCGHYEDGLQEGKHIRYYQDGSICSIHNFKQNQRHGITIEYEATQIFMMEYFANKLNGIAICWYITGGLKYRCRFVNDVNQGPYKSYHENGVKAEEGVYLNGKKNGWVTKWHPQGSLRSRKVYVNGMKN